MKLNQVYSFHLCTPRAQTKAIWLEDEERVQVCANLIDDVTDFQRVMNYYVELSSLRTPKYSTASEPKKRSSLASRDCARRSGPSTSLRYAVESFQPASKECFDKMVKKEFFEQCQECQGKKDFIYDHLYNRCFADYSPISGFLDK